MPFVVVAAVPRSQPLGAAQTPCPRCRGPRTLERRWHAFFLFVLPLFTLRTRVVAVCARCKIEEPSTEQVPAGAPGVPLLHRFGWTLPFLALGVFLATLIVPFQMRKRAEAALEATAGGRSLSTQLREARGGGCEGVPSALNGAACAVMGAVNGRVGSASVRMRAQGTGTSGMLVTIQSVKLQDQGAAAALEAARLARDLVAKTLQKDQPLVVVVGDFKDPRAFVAGKVGGDFLEDSGGSVDLGPAAALVGD